MDKLIKDGMVAVLVSPGYGAGWYSWNRQEALLFDSILVQHVLDGDLDLAMERAKEICPDAYLGGGDQLVVEWIPVGAKFEIEEYDGFESLSLLKDKDYLVG